jgi:hypothetical protein
MPAAFDSCVARGGRVRTKKLSGNRYMHICFIGGKSYAGEVKTKEELEKDELEFKKAKEARNEVKFDETLSFAIDIDEGVNDDKRTVKVCALAPCISRNNHYYSPAIVEKAAKDMLNKRIKSFSGHDDRNPRNIVGYIKESAIENGKAIATIKFSKAKDVAESIFTRIKEGIITDVSIAASGTPTRMKIGRK